MTPKTVPIAITTADGVAIMRIVEEGWFSPDAAAQLGFELVEGDVYRREVTDEVVEAEIGRSGIEHSGWRRISEDDLPDRSTRQRWNPDFSVKPEETRIPDRVTSRQFKMQLEKDGLLIGVEAWVSGQSKLVQIAYANSGTFVRSEPMMQAGFAALGFSTERIDAFFTAAAAL